MIKKIIALEDIELLAPVGFYKEERILKNTFLVNVSVTCNFEEGEDSDDIKNTVNYENLFEIVEKEMNIECRLIENAVSRIISRILKMDAVFEAIQIDIRKKNPPLKGKVKYSMVALHWEKEV